MLEETIVVNLFLLCFLAFIFPYLLFLFLFHVEIQFKSDQYDCLEFHPCFSQQESAKKA